MDLKNLIAEDHSSYFIKLRLIKLNVEKLSNNLLIVLVK